MGVQLVYAFNFYRSIGKRPYSTLITIEVRSGDPSLFPAENSSGVPMNPAYNAVQHGPGFNISFEQISDSTCPSISTSLIGNYQ